MYQSGMHTAWIRDLGLPLCTPAFTRTGGCILSIGENDALLASRELVLQRAKFNVVSCTALESAHLLTGSTFDLVLICRSVSRADASALALGSHLESPLQRVVILRDADPEEMLFFDAAIESARGPEYLLRGLACLMKAA